MKRIAHLAVALATLVGGLVVVAATPAGAHTATNSAAGHILPDRCDGDNADHSTPAYSSPSSHNNGDFYACEYGSDLEQPSSPNGFTGEWGWARYSSGVKHFALAVLSNPTAGLSTMVCVKQANGSVAGVRIDDTTAANRLQGFWGSNNRWQNGEFWWVVQGTTSAYPNCAGAAPTDASAPVVAPVQVDGGFPAYECSRTLREVAGVWYADFKARALVPPKAFEYDSFYWLGPSADPNTQAMMGVNDQTALEFTYKLGTLSQMDSRPGNPVGVDGTIAFQFNVFRYLWEGSGTTETINHHFDPATWPEDSSPAELPAHEANAAEASSYGIPVGASYITATCALVANPRNPEAGAIGETGGLFPDRGLGDTDPNGGSYIDRLKACVPAGIGILNPLNFVSATGCVLKWAFIPQDDFGDHVADLANETQASALVIPTGGLSAVFGSFGRLEDAYEGAAADGCNGPSFTLPDSSNLGDVANRTIHPLSSCAEPMTTAALWARRIGLLVFYVGFGFFISGLFLKTILGVTPGKVEHLDRAAHKGSGKFSG